MVLAGLVTTEGVTFGVAAEPGLGQEVGEPVHPGIELRVAEPAIPPDQKGLITDGLGHRAEYRR